MRLLSREPREVVEEEAGRGLVEEEEGRELVEVVEVVGGGELVDEDEVVEGRTAYDEPMEGVETTGGEETTAELGRAVVATGVVEATTGAGDEATTRDVGLTTVGVGGGDLGAPVAGGDAGP
jgi:hypothetical protein